MSNQHLVTSRRLRRSLRFPASVLIAVALLCIAVDWTSWSGEVAAAAGADAAQNADGQSPQDRTKRAANPEEEKTDSPDQPQASPKKRADAKRGPKWTPLFDGKSLKGWKITKFGGEGEVAVEKGRLILGIGNDMTGVTTTRKVPKINYEVELEAMRVDGTDFFCGLTFPVKKDPCTLIVGGWGGGVSGLSSIDGLDAAENHTTTYREFEKGRWYRIRLRVASDRIRAWIDDKEIVNQEITGRKISIRSEVELSQPFGFSTWQTKGALRNIRIRRLTKEEIKAEASKEK